MRDRRLAEAFLQAIHANPEDDTPRLVYADWLDEHDDSARAEFIRVQCEKARLPRWHRRWPLLAWRERVLLTRYGPIWQAELPTIEGVEWVVFERGFIHEIHAETPTALVNNTSKIRAAAPIRWATIGTWEEPGDSQEDLSFLVGLRMTDGGDDIYTHPDRIFQAPLLSTLKALDLSGLNMEGEQFAALGQSTQLANLETLVLDDCYMGDGNLRPFAESAQFRNLTTLSMKGNRYGYHEDARIRPPDAALLARSPYLANLRSLDLSGNEIDGPALFDLLESPHLASLRELTLSHNRMTEEGLARLFEARTATRLHRLALDHNPIGDAGAQLLAGADFCAELRDLDLDTCEVKPRGLRHLADAPWFGGLGRLNLSHNVANADGIHALARGCSSQALSELHLRDTELETEAMMLLADSPNLRGLQILDLSENTLDEEALRVMTVSRHWTQLRELYLERCKLDEASIQVLRAAACLPHLLHVSLADNPIGDRGLSLLLGSGGLSDVHQLTLRSCGLTREAIPILADAGLTELHWLDLSGNKIGNGAVEVLVHSPLTASLVELDLSGNEIGDKAAIAIAAVEWPLLTTLRLAANQITDKGALALAKARLMPRLRQVHCRNNRIEWRTFQQLGPRFRQY